jgi:uncharacterized membrane protein
MPTDATITQNPTRNWKTLGTLWIVYGIVRLIVAILLVIYSGVATVMFGALLVRVPDALSLMSIFHFFYIVAIIIIILSGIFSVVAGLALLAARTSARALSLTAALLALADLPLGTTLGTYTLVLFLR